jgi:hypothetical protein
MANFGIRNEKSAIRIPPAAIHPAFPCPPPVLGEAPGPAGRAIPSDSKAVVPPWSERASAEILRQSWLGKTAGGQEEDRNPSLTDINEAVDYIGDLPGRPYRRRIWAGLERRSDGGTHQERVESSEKLHPKVHPL